MDHPHIVTLIIILPDNTEVLTLHRDHERSLRHVLQLAANTQPFSFALQYNGPQLPGYRPIMINNVWAIEQAQPVFNAWSVIINGIVFQEGIETYMVEDKDVVQFIFNPN